MTEADYRAMASEIRDLIPLLMHAQAVADMRSLADRYERLAHYLEVVDVESVDLYSHNKTEQRAT
jgi:hypothetical protein